MVLNVIYTNNFKKKSANLVYFQYICVIHIVKVSKELSLQI